MNMAIGPEQIGTGIKLDEMEQKIANCTDKKIEEKLLLEEKGKRRYKINIVVENRLSDNVITAVKNKYHDVNWKEVLIAREEHMQSDVPDGPFTYVVQLDI